MELSRCRRFKPFRGHTHRFAMLTRTASKAALIRREKCFFSAARRCFFSPDSEQLFFILKRVTHFKVAQRHELGCTVTLRLRCIQHILGVIRRAVATIGTTLNFLFKSGRATHDKGDKETTVCRFIPHRVTQKDKENTLRVEASKAANNAKKMKHACPQTQTAPEKNDDGRARARARASPLIFPAPTQGSRAGPVTRE